MTWSEDKFKFSLCRCYCVSGSFSGKSLFNSCRFKRKWNQSSGSNGIKSSITYEPSLTTSGNSKDFQSWTGNIVGVCNKKDVIVFVSVIIIFGLRFSCFFLCPLQHAHMNVSNSFIYISFPPSLPPSLSPSLSLLPSFPPLLSPLLSPSLLFLSAINLLIYFLSPSSLFSTLPFNSVIAN